MRWRIPALLALSFGCGPVQSSTLIIDAAAELAAAKTAQADQHAPFEYVAAEAYLHKAREEQSYADFQVAVTYAEKSRDCARVARARAEAMTKEAMGTARLTRTTKSRCRPGPERLIPLPDPSEEASTLKAKPKKTEPAKAPPDKAQPKKPIKPIKPGEPADPLPEGDDQ